MSILSVPARCTPPKGHGYSDIGRQREHNEDSWLTDDALGIYAVADGIGGSARGEIASQLAVSSVHRAATCLRESRGPEGFAALNDVELREAVASMVALAARRIAAYNAEYPARRSSGTTLTVALFAGTRVAMAHVGDSRLYLERDGALLQLSADHTVAAELARVGQGEIGARWGHVLTRSLGSEFQEPEVALHDVEPGDVYLLCSDGLTRELSDEELCTELARSDEWLPARLVSLANERGGRDNITAVVVRIDGARRRSRRIRALWRWSS